MGFLVFLILGSTIKAIAYSTDGDDAIWRSWIFLPTLWLRIRLLALMGSTTMICSSMWFISPTRGEWPWPTTYSMPSLRWWPEILDQIQLLIRMFRRMIPSPNCSPLEHRDSEPSGYPLVVLRYLEIDHVGLRFQLPIIVTG